MFPVLNNYYLVEMPLPMNQDFRYLSKVEAKKYYEWFMSVKNERFKYISSFLLADKNKLLNESHIHLIESALFEAKDFYEPKKIIRPTDIPVSVFQRSKHILEDSSTLFCYDIGIALGEIFVECHNDIFWDLELRKKMADCNQPTLIRPSYPFAVNPFRVSKNLFARIYDNEFEKGQLAKVIDAWRKAFKLDCRD